jgi:hypothetical protein
MSKEERKKQRDAVQLAWRLLLSYGLDPDDKKAAAAADTLVEAFPEYLGPS